MQLTAIPDPLPVPRGSAAAAAPVTAVAPTAAMSIEAPADLPDFGSSDNADTASRTAARSHRSGTGTPVDAPATIAAFSPPASEAGTEAKADPTAELLNRFREAIAPEKVFGTEASDVPGAKPANLARELARASVMAAKEAAAQAAAEVAPAPQGDTDTTASRAA